MHVHTHTFTHTPYLLTRALIDEPFKVPSTCNLYLALDKSPRVWLFVRCSMICLQINTRGESIFCAVLCISLQHMQKAGRQACSQKRPNNNNKLLSVQDCQTSHSYYCFECDYVGATSHALCETCGHLVPQ